MLVGRNNPSRALVTSTQRATIADNEVMIVKKEFHVVVEKDADGWYVASAPALRGCHTQAKSLDVPMKRIREAIALCLEVEPPTGGEFVGVQRVAVEI